MPMFRIFWIGFIRLSPATLSVSTGYVACCRAGPRAFPNLKRPVLSRTG
jgi:hypothetical protein